MAIILLLQYCTRRYSDVIAVSKVLTVCPSNSLVLLCYSLITCSWQLPPYYCYSIPYSHFLLGGLLLLLSRCHHWDDDLAPTQQSHNPMEHHRMHGTMDKQPSGPAVWHLAWSAMVSVVEVMHQLHCNPSRYRHVYTYSTRMKMNVVTIDHQQHTVGLLFTNRYSSTGT